MVSPHPGDLVNQRGVGVRVGGRQANREITLNEGPRQTDIGQHDEKKLPLCRRTPDTHQREPVAMCADHRHGGLYQRENQRKDEGEMTKLCNHCCTLSAALFICAESSAYWASTGM